MQKKIEDFRIKYKTGIKRSTEFARKGLANFSVNVGVRCGHQCLYCSAPTSLFTHRAFKVIGRSAFSQGFSAVAPDVWQLVRATAAGIKESERGVVMVCSMTDAWAQEAQRHGLGRKIIQALMAEPGWQARILTKNSALEDDFELISRYRDRITLSLSTTSTNDEVGAIIEPFASPPRERLGTLRKAKEKGLRVYGMLCPIHPYQIDTDFEELFREVADLDPQRIWVEPVNPRGKAIKAVAGALAECGFNDLAKSVNDIRTKTNWDSYALRLIEKTQALARKYYSVQKVSMLIYRSSFSNPHVPDLIQDKSGVIFL